MAHLTGRPVITPDNHCRKPTVDHHAFFTFAQPPMPDARADMVDFFAVCVFRVVHCGATLPPSRPPRLQFFHSCGRLFANACKSQDFTMPHPQILDAEHAIRGALHGGKPVVPAVNPGVLGMQLAEATR